MLRSICAIGVLAFVLNASAIAQEKYTIHEGLRPGDKIPSSLTVNQKFKGTVTRDGATTRQDTETTQVLNAVGTVIAVKDGSATEAAIEILPGSFSTTKEGSGPVKKDPCSVVGQTITFRRHVDESITNDFQGDIDPTDRQNLEGFISPDEDYFPDKPVAAGDSWDVSDKVSKHSELGRTDKLLAQCRLDWVKEIDGKKMAQITCVSGTVRHGDNDYEEDIECTSVCLVDIAAGQIIKADQTGTSHDFSPKDSATPTDLTGEFKIHGEGQTTTRGAATRE